MSSGHNDPKYLGSTGFFPALQSYLCRWNNTCHNYSQTTGQFNANASYVDLIPSNILLLLFFSSIRFWKDLSQLSENLQMILNDGESFNSLTNLSSQLNSLRNQTNIWDGKYRSPTIVKY